MKKRLAGIVLAPCLIAGILIQTSLLEPIRGQTMSMPFIATGIWFIVLIVIYSIAYLCDNFLQSKFFRITGILLLLGIIVYTVKRYWFYEKLRNGDIPIDEWDSDYFAPGDENYFVIGFFSIIALIYYSLKFFYKKKQGIS